MLSKDRSMNIVDFQGALGVLDADPFDRTRTCLSPTLASDNDRDA